MRQCAIEQAAATMIRDPVSGRLAMRLPQCWQKPRSFSGDERYHDVLSPLPAHRSLLGNEHGEEVAV